MYCPECGKFNPDENVACQYCGVRLADNSQPQNPQPEYSYNPADNYEQNYQENIDGSSPGDVTDDLFGDAMEKIKNYDYSKIKTGLEKALEFAKAKKAIVIPVAAVLVIFIAFLAIGSAATSPKKIAKGYFEAFIEADYAEMFDYVAVLDSDFITDETFTQYMTKQYSSGSGFENVNNFTIEEVRGPGSDKHTKAYYAEYYDSITGRSDTYVITLVKQSSKSLLFFDNYKVTLGENIMTQEAKLAIPSGFKATIDGVKLDEMVAAEQDDYYSYEGYDVYRIPAILNGKHKVVLKSEMFDDFTTEVSYYGEYGSTQRVGDFSSMNIKADIASALQKRAVSDLQAIYTSALAGANASAVNVAVSPAFDNFADCYSSICNRIVGYQEGTGLKSFNITKSSIYVSSYGNPNGINISSSDSGITASFRLDYSYNFSKAVYNYGSPDLTIENGTKDYDTSFRYALIDGEWKLDYIGSYNISY